MTAGFAYIRREPMLRCATVGVLLLTLVSQPGARQRLDSAGTSAVVAADAPGPDIA